MEGLQVALSEGGFELFEPDDSNLLEDESLDYVVVGLDRRLTEAKAERAMLCIRAGAECFATHRDRKVNTNRGFLTGAAKTVGAVAERAGVERRVIGKPEKPIFDQAIAALGFPHQEIAMVGDNQLTDILGGRRAGLHTVLVLSGVTSRLDLESDGVKAPDSEVIEPDEICDDLRQWADQLTARDPEYAPPAQYRPGT